MVMVRLREVAGYTYLIPHTTSMDDCVKAARLLDHVRWALTGASAARRAADLGYAVLPDAVREKVMAKLVEVTCDNQPVMK